MKVQRHKNNWFGVGARVWREPGAWIVVLRLGHWQWWLEGGIDDEDEVAFVEKDLKNAVKPMEIRDGSGSGIEIPPPDTRAVVHEIVREEALAAIRERDALRVEVEALTAKLAVATSPGAGEEPKP